MRSRLLPHGLFWGVVWPLLSALAASLDVADRQLYPFRYAIGVSGLGLLVLLPQILLAALVLAAATVLAFGAPASGPAPFRLRLAEPFLFLAALLAFAATRFPALVHHPFLLPFRPLPTRFVLLGLVAFAVLLLGARAAEEPDGRRRAALFLAPLGLAALIGRFGGPHAPAPPAVARESVVLLGLDSVAASDLEGGPLEAFARVGARTYTKAVAPALITNAVWASVLLGEPPLRTGILLGLQGWSPGDREEGLTRRASAAGLRTVATFPNRSTAWVGACGGFDRDEGGAVGWRQMATAWLKDAGVAMPLLLPLLPEAPFAATPRNQVDTFTYDLEADLLRIAGAAGENALVAAHVTFLHENRYPSFDEMTAEERERVLAAPAALVFDDSFNWRHEDAPDAPVPLRRAKWARLQSAVVSAIRAGGLAEPENRNVLVLFADHGPRAGLQKGTFRRRKFWHVPLVVWGDRSRLPTGEPVSLSEISRIVGLSGDGERSAPPSVAFADVTLSDWKEMEGRVRLRWDGTTELPPDVVARIVRGAELFVPGPVDFAERATEDPR